MLGVEPRNEFGLGSRPWRAFSHRRVSLWTDPFPPALATGSRVMSECLTAHYGSVRRPAGVFHSRKSLGFTTRPTSRFVFGLRISGFERRLFPCILRVSDLAGYHRAFPLWRDD